MNRIALPATMEGLLAAIEAMPRCEIRCPVCREPWSRPGATVPRGFDGICPECYDQGHRAGFRRDNAPKTRAEFLSVAGFPAALCEEFRSWRVRGLDWSGGSSAWALGYTGPTDTGKSMLLAEITWRNRERYRSPFFIRSDRLVSALFGRLGDEAKVSHYARATECSLLILDDIGWGNRGGAMDPIFEILALRHGDRMATLWTSNSSIEEIMQLNAPMARRMLEGLVVPLQAGSKPWGKRNEK